jgi:hypothetical protein
LAGFADGGWCEPAGELPLKYPLPIAYYTRVLILPLVRKSEGYVDCLSQRKGRTMFRLLFIGDVVGEAGCAAVRVLVPTL